MATLAVMKSRIANELDRPELSSEIAVAISDAIAEHERERFWFNESRDLTFSTVATQRIYTSSDASWIPNVIEIDAMFVSIGGRLIELIKDDPAYMELLSDNSAASGQPTSWAYFNKSIQLYPIPDAVYTVRALAHYRLAELTDDSQSNAWTTEAEALIRHTAKIMLALDVTGNPEDADSMDTAVQRHLSYLRAETSRRKATGCIRPTDF